MRWYKLYVLLFCLSVPFLARSQGRGGTDSLVQVSGVTMTADSLRAVPNVSVIVKGEDRGTITNDEGVFSIVVYKGDVLTFRAIGFKTQDVQIPSDIKGNHFSLLHLMAQDTTYLPVTVIKPYPSRGEFADAFLHWKIPDDKLEIARKNTNAARLRAMAASVGPDGGEGVNRTFQQQAQALYYSGQRPPENIFNPVAWAQFIQAWKEGAFKRQD